MILILLVVFREPVHFLRNGNWCIFANVGDAFLFVAGGGRNGREFLIFYLIFLGL